MASAGIDLLEGLPEPQRAVTDRDLGRDGEPASLHLDQELTPALSALPDTDLEAHQFLRALGRRADHDQHAFGMLLHPGLQVDAVGPDVEIAARRQGQGADLLETRVWDVLSDRAIMASYSASRSLRTAAI